MTVPHGVPRMAVEFSQMRGEPWVLTSRATVTVPERGLLVWNQRYDKNLQVRVNGVAVPLIEVNKLWCGVELPAGQHTVTCQMKVNPFWNIVSVVVGFGIIGWFVKEKVVLR